jgi:hypothetical protein
VLQCASPKLPHYTRQSHPNSTAAPKELCLLTEELVALGHEVTLFASGDSRTAATLVPSWPLALRLDPAVRDTIAPHMLLMEQVRQRACEFDLIHFHMDYWPFRVRP